MQGWCAVRCCMGLGSVWFWVVQVLRLGSGQSFVIRVWLCARVQGVGAGVAYLSDQALLYVRSCHG
jgi:hypothetical protein